MLKEKKKEEMLQIQEKFEKVQEKRKKQEEQKLNQLLEKQDKMKEKNEKRDKELLEFYKKQKKKVKNQMKEIIKKRQEYLDKFKEKSPEKNSFKAIPKPNYSEKDKEYFELENKLVKLVEDLRMREDISSIFNKYKKNLKLIYEIYSKIGYNKISFYSKECIRLAEFKQFLTNFAVLGMLITTEQMNFIFNKIAQNRRKDRDDQLYLDFDDFQLSLCLLSIYSKFSEKTKRISQADLDNTSGQAIEYFFKFLGLKLPYDKLEMEKFITERRGLSIKDLIELQKKIKNNANDYRKGEFGEEKKSEKSDNNEEEGNEKEAEEEEGNEEQEQVEENKSDNKSNNKKK